jgi:hypothetical protein
MGDKEGVGGGGPRPGRGRHCSSRLPLRDDLSAAVALQECEGRGGQPTNGEATGGSSLTRKPSRAGRGYLVRSWPLGEKAKCGGRAALSVCLARPPEMTATVQLRFCCVHNC